MEKAATTHDLDEAAQRLEPWADSLELAMLVDADNRVLAVNRAFARKFGKPSPEWPGKSSADLVHPEDANAWTNMRSRVERPPYHISCEHRWKTVQGWRWIAWEETAVRDEEGRVRAVRAIGRDVTKHRLAEEHFRKLAQAVEQAPVSIAMTTPGGLPQYVNSRFTETTGYTLEDIFEMEIPVLREGHSSESAYRAFCARVAAGHKWSGELRTKRKDGGEVWEFVTVSPIRNHADEITHLLCLREDITERKGLEDQLRQAQKMESLGTMAGGIAHDFNNIISIIRGFTELALSMPLDESVSRYLGAVHDAAVRAAGLVGQILTFSRKAEVAYKPVRIDDVVHELMGMFAETFPRTIELRREVDPGIEPILADPNQMRQLLVNLCVNARDAMPDGGVLTVATRRMPGVNVALPKADPEQEYLCIDVSDTGCGMSEDVRGRIFEPFFTTRQGDGGTGLGLAVVYGVVANHHGLVGVDSEPGRGTTFHVYLPLRRPAAEDTQAIIGGRDVHVPPGSERVLLVDDEAAILELLGTVLGNAGYRVQTAMDGAEAIEILLSGASIPPDAIVLDLNMPRMSGLDVLRIAASNLPEVPVLVTSGNLTPVAVAEIEKLGYGEPLTKPFELKAFGEGLRALLDRGKRAPAGN